MQPKDVVKVGDYVTEWSRCLTGRYQRDRLYRFGKFDDCGRQWRDMMTAMWIKFAAKDVEEAQQLVKETYFHRRTTESTTVGVIWDLKEKPGWD